MVGKLLSKCTLSLVWPHHHHRKLQFITDILSKREETILSQQQRVIEMDIYQEVMLPLAIEVSKNIITGFTRVLGYGSQSCKLLSHICSSFILMQRKVGEFLILKACKISYQIHEGKKIRDELLQQCMQMHLILNRRYDVIPRATFFRARLAMFG